MFARHLLLAAAFVASTLAVQTALVVIEASHGGAESDLTNTTVSIPINHAYTNTTALAEVSTLYLIGSTNVPIDSITCTPFHRPDGTEVEGHVFNSSAPSYLSTNTVKVGSIICITSSISYAPPGLPVSSGAASSVTVTTHTKAVAATTSTLVKTATPNTDVTATDASQAAASSTASASASASTGNSASALYLSGEFFGGLALAGFGLAFAL